ncbi:MAG: hypothetical protein ACQERX_02100 [Bacillota bacterium]
MASSGAGKWIIGILVYFFIFITLVTYASNFDTDVTYSGEEVINKSIDEFESECYTPDEGREYIYISDGVLFGDTLNDDSDVRCEYTKGMADENLCNLIEGCNWANITYDEGFWFWEEDLTRYQCNGSVNTTYFNNGEVFSEDNSLCLMSNLSDSELQCRLFGCEWFETGKGEKEFGVTKAWGELNSMWDTMIGLFVFDVDLGIPEEYQGMFIFVFFYIPFFILLLAIYLILPFVH